MKPKAYVACALTYVPGERKTEFEQLLALVKRVLRERGYEILEFVGLTGGTPQDVYHHDIHECVGRADILVALCDYPGTGLGYELCYAVEVRKIPVLAVAHTSSLVTRLVLGVDSKNYQFTHYGNPSHLAHCLSDWIRDRLPVLALLAEHKH